VGRTDFDTAQALADLPSVGGGLNPNLEAIVALEPDLVIRFAGDSDPATPRRLNQLGISHLAVRPDGLQDIRDIILDLGRVTGRGSKADSLLDQMAAELEALQDRVAGLPRVRVAYLLGGNPPWVAGPGTYIHELLELAGGTNVFTDMDALYGPVNAEVFLVREIDLILAPEGTEIVLPDSSIPVRRVSPDLEIPGPALARQAWTLARAIHPEAFQ
jgi:iron complex transport system substrate-binding protein